MCVCACVVQVCRPVCPDEKPHPVVEKHRPQRRRLGCSSCLREAVARSPRGSECAARRGRQVCGGSFPVLGQVRHPHRDSERARDSPKITHLVLEPRLADPAVQTVPFCPDTSHVGFDSPASLRLHHGSSQTAVTGLQCARQGLRNLALDLPNVALHLPTPLRPH